MTANDAPSAPGEPAAHRSRNPTVGWRVMAEDLDPEIAAALAKLAQQDAGPVGNAKATREWMGEPAARSAC